MPRQPLSQRAFAVWWQVLHVGAFVAERSETQRIHATNRSAALTFVRPDPGHPNGGGYVLVGGGNDFLIAERRERVRGGS
jgi:hypothetical protein